MNLKDAIEMYKSVGHRNADFLFNWLYNIYSNVYLPCIDIKMKDKLAEDKTKLTIFDVLGDDLSDNPKMIDYNLLKKFMQIPWNFKNKQKNPYLEVARKIWEDCITSIKKYPRFRDIEKIFFFDLKQILISMKYSFLVNTYRIDNSIEMNIFPPHGCMVILHCDMDLMCSPKFDMKDISNIRVIFLLAQKIAHIGNMLNTYPREFEERDMSCPLISFALRKGIITEDELGKEEALLKLKKLEPIFLNRAKNYIRMVSLYENKVKSVNVSGFSESLNFLLTKFIEREQYWKLNR
mgnify:CR=1 FL=1